MNDIDLTKILKDCPKGWKLWSPIFGEVEFDSIFKTNVFVNIKEDEETRFLADATFPFGDIKSVEVMLYPSKEQRDWSKFTVPWYKKDRFDPTTLKPFDKVLARDGGSGYWSCQLFSYIVEDEVECPYSCVSNFYNQCIPYNDDTKHLVGTTEEAPEYYRYWED